MRYLALAALLSTALLGAHGAAAQEQAASNEQSEIVVTGTRDVDSQVRDFVGTLRPAGPRGQLARFEQGVCPAAIGLGAPQKAVVETRMRTVAKAAGIPVGEPGCSPNALVLVTKAKGAFLEGLRRQRPEYFGDLTPTQIRRLLGTAGPAAAWQLQGQVNARGVAMDQDPGSGVPINRTSDVPSRMSTGARPVFEAAALVVETGALESLTTTQLADYAAMRLFARTDPSRLATPAPPTILSVLEAPMGSEIPVTLTKWDLNLLRGLYAAPANIHLGAQRAAIGQQINRERANAEEAAAQ